MAYCGPKGIPLSAFLSWADADQDAALMWHAHEGQRCPQCGTHPDDWREDRRSWVAEAHRCWGCQAVEAKHAELEKVENRGRGVRVHLKRREE
jgi:hypothetical protein